MHLRLNAARLHLCKAVAIKGGPRLQTVSHKGLDGKYFKLCMLWMSSDYHTFLLFKGPLFLMCGLTKLKAE